jgi:hypothetical protein
LSSSDFSRTEMPAATAAGALRGVVLLHRQLLRDAEQAVGEHVDAEAGGEKQHHGRENGRHHVLHHLLLRGVHLLRHDLLLDERRRAQQHRQDERQVPRSDVDGIRRREVAEPEKRRVVQLGRRLQRGVEREPDRHLHQHRQAAGEGVHAVLPPELHRGELLLLGVVLELLVERVDLRLDLAHLRAALDRLPREGEEQRAHRHREEDDRDAPAADDLVALGEEEDQHLGDGCERSELDQIREPVSAAAGRREDVALLRAREMKHLLRRALAGSEVLRGVGEA